MPRQRTPAAARFGGAITRRHAALLLQSGIDGGGGVACVKDLRAHRVVPPASASLDSSSPECVAGAKPEPVDSTPPEDVAAVAAVVEDLERKPIGQVLPRSKLVRDPGSFGYRRLLPFLNQMAKNDDSNCKEMPLENTAANSSKEFKGSRIWLFEESGGGGYRESDLLESAELVTLKTGGEPEMKDGCDIVGKGTNTVPRDLAGNKPSLTRCTNSRFVHHKSSFSYKRMLPFLMENEISSYEGERIKIRRVAEETQLAPDKNDVSASGKHHLALSEDPSSECKSAPMENIEEEKSSNADENQILENLQRQPDVLKTSSPERSSAEVQNIIPREASVLSQDPITSYEGESTSDGIDVLAGEQHLPLVSEDVPEECSRDVTKTIVQDKELESDGSYVLEPAVSEASPLEDSTSGGQKTTEQPYGDEGSTLTLDKNEFLTKEKPQLCDTKELLTAQVEETVEVPKPQLCDTSELLTAQVEGTVEFPKVLQCQSPDLGCPDVGLGSPTKTVIPSANQCCTLEHQEAMASLDDPHLDAVMICRTSDPCAVDKFLSVEEMSGAVPHTEPGSSKVGILQQSEGLSLGKRGLSPKKLSPRKGILKRHTRGCKGICMCLDCSTYRLRADRAFEFSRKQMQEADDIIGNLLKEMANLRCLVEKPAGQRGSIQAACQRSSQVEEVARDRCHQMFMDLNSHCRIPGPRVRFTQFVEEKLGSSPHSSKHLEDNMVSSPRSSKHLVDKMGWSPRSNKHVEDNMGSSPHSNSFSKRRCLKR